MGCRRGRTVRTVNPMMNNPTWVRIPPRQLTNIVKTEAIVFNIYLKKYMGEKIIDLIKQGKTFNEIKKELGCSLSTISYHCKKEGIVSKNTTKKTDDQTIQKINELYESGLTCIQVSKKLGISKATVLKYIKFIRNEKLSDSQLKKNRVNQVIYWRIKVKKLLVEYKGGECERCGYKKCIDALDFHHKNPSEKDFTIGGKSWSLERLKKEADKCILVCANCHREIHFEIKNGIFPDSSEAEQTTTYDKKIHTKEC